MTKQKYRVGSSNDSQTVAFEIEEESCLTLYNTDLQKVSSGLNNVLSVDSFGLFGRPSVLKSKWWDKKRRQTFYLFGQLVSLVAYVLYMIYAIWYDTDNATLLIFDFCVVIVWVAAHAERSRRVFKLAGSKIVKVHSKLKTTIPYLRKIITVVVILAILGFLVYDWYHDPKKLVPFGGLIILLLIVLVTSRSPSKVHWTPVIWGVILQFILGLLILRWPTGYSVVQFLGDQVAAFLAYTDAGSKFVFGEKGLEDHPVVFKILPVVVFFSAMINVLYYLGAMQVVIRAIARLLKFAMDTSPMESFATSAHIFVGQVESSIALKPFLNDISRSELNAVMTGGFATVAGTVIGAYIQFGVPANHLLAASFMSAPAALAVAKLGWPERKQKENVDISSIDVNAGKETNLMEAASAGATSTVKLIAYVVVNLIAFIAILSFIDAIISFYGDRVGHPEISFEWLCSYLFMPLALVLGIPWKDCRTVAKLIGKKIVLNEFLAYIDLGQLIKEGELENRSVVISTYILCGFGSIAAMGINLGALSAAEPNRRRDYARGMFRSFVCGNIACFMTACIAGMLYIEPLPVFSNSTLTNSSVLYLTITNSSLTNNITNVFNSTNNG